MNHPDRRSLGLPDRIHRRSVEESVREVPRRRACTIPEPPVVNTDAAETCLSDVHHRLKMGQSSFSGFRSEGRNRSWRPFPISRSDAMPCCPFCDHENPVGVRHCPSCGADLLTSIGSVQGLEDMRQQVSASERGSEDRGNQALSGRTGVGLKEAKDAVEAIQRGERPQDLADSDNSFHQTLVSLLKQGRKIDAIRVFREVTGSGLKESRL